MDKDNSYIGLQEPAEDRSKAGRRTWRKVNCEYSTDTHTLIQYISGSHVNIALGAAVGVLLLTVIILAIRTSHGVSENCSSLTADTERLQAQNSRHRQVLTQLLTNLPSLEKYCPVRDSESQERVCQPCPQGWQSFNSKCYYFSTERQRWNDSQAACRDQGANLVVIESREEQEFIWRQSIKASWHYWIGLTGAVKCKAWLWVDGSSLNVQYWAPGEPNDIRGKEECVATAVILNPLHNWVDLICSQVHRWICEGNRLQLTA
ncbi:C209A protein, partial [Amia calva]|nr:C209A protein [Amia calva]